MDWTIRYIEEQLEPYADGNGITSDDKEDVIEELQCLFDENYDEKKQKIEQSIKNMRQSADLATQAVDKIFRNVTSCNTCVRSALFYYKNDLVLLPAVCSGLVFLDESGNLNPTASWGVRGQVSGVGHANSIHNDLTTDKLTNFFEKIDKEKTQSWTDFYQKLQDYANQGIVVIGSMSGRGGANGHIVMVTPGKLHKPKEKNKWNENDETKESGYRGESISVPTILECGGTTRKAAAPLWERVTRSRSEDMQWYKYINNKKKSYNMKSTGILLSIVISTIVHAQHSSIPESRKQFAKTKSWIVPYEEGLKQMCRPYRTSSKNNEATKTTFCYLHIGDKKILIDSTLKYDILLYSMSPNGKHIVITSYLNSGEEDLREKDSTEVYYITIKNEQAAIQKLPVKICWHALVSNEKGYYFISEGINMRDSWEPTFSPLCDLYEAPVERPTQMTFIGTVWAGNYPAISPDGKYLFTALNGMDKMPITPKIIINLDLKRYQYLYGDRDYNKHNYVGHYYNCKTNTFSYDVESYDSDSLVCVEIPKEFPYVLPVNTDRPTDRYQPTFITHHLLYKAKKKELSGLTKEQLRILRNTFFAHSGYPFESKDLQQFFNQFDWYRQIKKLSLPENISVTEQKRINLIRKIEEEKQ